MKHKVAMIGFRHGHIETLYKRFSESSEIEIVGGCEEHLPSREEAVAHGIKITHDNFELMLSELDFDILAIGDYFGIRGARAIRGLETGRHVIADKPLCTSLAELETIRILSSEKHLKVGMMLDMRMNRNVAAAKGLIDSDRLGEIHAINFNGQHNLSYGTRPAWYFEPGKQGGTINDIAIHGTDLCEYLTGCPISKIDYARTWNAVAVQEKEFHDAAQMMFELENGCGVLADISYFSPAKCPTPFYWRFTMWGTKGVIEFDYNSNGVTFYEAGKEASEILPPCDGTSDYLSIFLRETKGFEESFGTKHVIEISRKTLEMQHLADQRT